MADAASISVVTASPRWCVVQSHAYREKEAKYHLDRQGFETYLPLRLGHPKSKNPIQPFFPRLVFVKVDPEVQRWRCLLSTIGVHSLLMTAGGAPGVIADRDLAPIREREVDGLIQLQAATEVLVCPFKAGDRVRIADLPIEALFVRELGDGRRVELLTSLFGKDHTVTKPLREVRAA